MLMSPGLFGSCQFYHVLSQTCVDHYLLVPTDRPCSSFVHVRSSAFGRYQFVFMPIVHPRYRREFVSGRAKERTTPFTRSDMVLSNAGVWPEHVAWSPSHISKWAVQMNEYPGLMQLC